VLIRTRPASNGMKEKFYLTTSIVYTNAAPHIGFAYELLIADIIVRYKRLQGINTHFLTGTDEHGTKIAKAAEAKGVNTQKFVDENTTKVKALVKALGVDEHDFIRTSDRKRHWLGAQKLWQKIEKSGDLYKKKYKGLYCEGHEVFHTDNGIVNGECPDYPGRKLGIIEEENYFFRLSKYTGELKKKLESGEIKITPESRKAEMISVINEGLEDVSFSRNVKSNPWGIPVPNDPTQTMYVWCDALSNYITALGYGTSDDLNFKKFWLENKNIVHLIGKDILRFHALIWPAMLMSAGIMPEKLEILVHGFITVDGKKMSKSLGNVIDPMALIEKYNREAFRYYFAREISPFEDGDFNEKKFIESYNANLANGLGNLLSRIMKMAEDNLGEPVPGFGKRKSPIFHSAMKGFNIQSAMDHIWKHISELDEFIQKEKPFKIIKENKVKGIEIIKKSVSELFHVAELLGPFLPDTSRVIQDLIRKNKMPAKPLFPRRD